MDTVFLITDGKKHQKTLSRALPKDCSVVVLDSSSELSGSISLNPCLAVVDLTSSMQHRLRMMEEIHRDLPLCSIVTLLPEQYREEKQVVIESVYDTLYAPMEVPVLKRIVKHALERGTAGILEGSQRQFPAVGSRGDTDIGPDPR